MKNIREFALETKHDKIAFLPGEILRGELYITLEEKTEIRSIKIFLQGEGAGQWLEQACGDNLTDQTKDGDGKLAKQMLLDIGLRAFGNSSKEDKVVPVHDDGRYVYEFQFRIPENLPPTFKSPIDRDLGYVRYYLKAILSRPRKNDKSARLAIVMNELISPNRPELLILPGSSESKDVTTNCMTSGSIFLETNLNHSYYVQGEKIMINATAENESTKIMKELYAKLVRRVRCKVRFGTKTYTTDTVSTHSDRIFANGRMEWKKHELVVPSIGPTVNNDKDIRVDYFVRVGMCEDYGSEVHLDLPVVIGTVGTEEEMKERQLKEAEEEYSEKQKREQYRMKCIKDKEERKQYRAEIERRVGPFDEINIAEDEHYYCIRGRGGGPGIFFEKPNTTKDGRPSPPPSKRSVSAEASGNKRARSKSGDRSTSLDGRNKMVVTPGRGDRRLSSTSDRSRSQEELDDSKDWLTGSTNRGRPVGKNDGVTKKSSGTKAEPTNGKKSGSLGRLPGNKGSKESLQGRPSSSERVKQPGKTLPGARSKSLDLKKPSSSGRLGSKERLQKSNPNLIANRSSTSSNRSKEKSKGINPNQGKDKHVATVENQDLLGNDNTGYSEEMPNGPEDAEDELTRSLMESKEGRAALAEGKPISKELRRQILAGQVEDGNTTEENGENKIEDDSNSIEQQRSTKGRIEEDNISAEQTQTQESEAPPGQLFDDEQQPNKLADRKLQQQQQVKKPQSTKGRIDEDNISAKQTQSQESEAPSGLNKQTDKKEQHQAKKPRSTKGRIDEDNISAEQTQTQESEPVSEPNKQTKKPQSTKGRIEEDNILAEQTETQESQPGPNKQSSEKEQHQAKKPRSTKGRIDEDNILAEQTQSQESTGSTGHLFDDKEQPNKKTDQESQAPTGKDERKGQSKAEGESRGQTKQTDKQQNKSKIKGAAGKKEESKPKENVQLGDTIKIDDAGRSSVGEEDEENKPTERTREEIERLHEFEELESQFKALSPRPPKYNMSPVENTEEFPAGGPTFLTSDQSPDDNTLRDTPRPPDDVEFTHGLSKASPVLKLELNDKPYEHRGLLDVPMSPIHEESMEFENENLSRKKNETNNNGKPKQTKTKTKAKSAKSGTKKTAVSKPATKGGVADKPPTGKTKKTPGKNHEKPGEKDQEVETNQKEEGDAEEFTASEIVASELGILGDQYNKKLKKMENDREQQEQEFNNSTLNEEIDENLVVPMLEQSQESEVSFNFDRLDEQEADVSFDLKRTTEQEQPPSFEFERLDEKQRDSEEKEKQNNNSTSEMNGKETGPATANKTAPATANGTEPTTVKETGPTTVKETGPITAEETGPTTAKETGPTGASLQNDQTESKTKSTPWGFLGGAVGKFLGKLKPKNQPHDEPAVEAKHQPTSATKENKRADNKPETESRLSQQKKQDVESKEKSIDKSPPELTKEENKEEPLRKTPRKDQVMEDDITSQRVEDVEQGNEDFLYQLSGGEDDNAADNDDKEFQYRPSDEESSNKRPKRLQSDETQSQSQTDESSQKYDTSNAKMGEDDGEIETTLGNGDIQGIQGHEDSMAELKDRESTQEKQKYGKLSQNEPRNKKDETNEEIQGDNTKGNESIEGEDGETSKAEDKERKNRMHKAPPENQKYEKPSQNATRKNRDGMGESSNTGNPRINESGVNSQHGTKQAEQQQDQTKENPKDKNIGKRNKMDKTSQREGSSKQRVDADDGNIQTNELRYGATQAGEGEKERENTKDRREGKRNEGKYADPIDREISQEKQKSGQPSTKRNKSSSATLNDAKQTTKDTGKLAKNNTSSKRTQEKGNKSTTQEQAMERTPRHSPAASPALSRVSGGSDRRSRSHSPQTRDEKKRGSTQSPLHHSPAVSPALSRVSVGSNRASRSHSPSQSKRNNTHSLHSPEVEQRRDESSRPNSASNSKIPTSTSRNSSPMHSPSLLHKGSPVAHHRGRVEESPSGRRFEQLQESHYSPSRSAGLGHGRHASSSPLGRGRSPTKKSTTHGKSTNPRANNPVKMSNSKDGRYGNQAVSNNMRDKQYEGQMVDDMHRGQQSPDVDSLDSHRSSISDRFQDRSAQGKQRTIQPDSKNPVEKVRKVYAKSSGALPKRIVCYYPNKQNSKIPHGKTEYIRQSSVSSVDSLFSVSSGVTAGEEDQQHKYETKKFGRHRTTSGLPVREKTKRPSKQQETRPTQEEDTSAREKRDQHTDEEQQTKIHPKLGTAVERQRYLDEMVRKSGGKKPKTKGVVKSSTQEFIEYVRNPKMSSAKSGTPLKVSPKIMDSPSRHIVTQSPSTDVVQPTSPNKRRYKDPYPHIQSPTKKLMNRKATTSNLAKDREASPSKKSVASRESSPKKIRTPSSSPVKSREPRTPTKKAQDDQTKVPYVSPYRQNKATKVSKPMKDSNILIYSYNPDGQANVEEIKKGRKSLFEKEDRWKTGGNSQQRIPRPKVNTNFSGSYKSEHSSKFGVKDLLSSSHSQESVGEKTFDGTTTTKSQPEHQKESKALGMVKPSSRAKSANDLPSDNRRRRSRQRGESLESRSYKMAEDKEAEQKTLGMVKPSPRAKSANDLQPDNRRRRSSQRGESLEGRSFKTAEDKEAEQKKSEMVKPSPRAKSASDFPSHNQRRRSSQRRESLENRSYKTAEDKEAERRRMSIQRQKIRDDRLADLRNKYNAEKSRFVQHAQQSHEDNSRLTQSYPKYTPSPMMRHGRNNNDPETGMLGHRRLPHVPRQKARSVSPKLSQSLNNDHRIFKRPSESKIETNQDRPYPGLSTSYDHLNFNYHSPYYRSKSTPDQLYGPNYRQRLSRSMDSREMRNAWSPQDYHGYVEDRGPTPPYVGHIEHWDDEHRGKRKENNDNLSLPHRPQDKRYHLNAPYATEKLLEEEEKYDKLQFKGKTEEGEDVEVVQNEKLSTKPLMENMIVEDGIVPVEQDILGGDNGNRDYEAELLKETKEKKVNEFEEQERRKEKYMEEERLRREAQHVRKIPPPSQVKALEGAGNKIPRCIVQPKGRPYHLEMQQDSYVPRSSVQPLQDKDSVVNKPLQEKDCLINDKEDDKGSKQQQHQEKRSAAGKKIKEQNVELQAAHVSESSKLPALAVGKSHDKYIQSINNGEPYASGCIQNTPNKLIDSGIVPAYNFFPIICSSHLPKKVIYPLDMKDLSNKDHSQDECKTRRSKSKSPERSKPLRMNDEKKRSRSHTPARSSYGDDTLKRKRQESLRLEEENETTTPTTTDQTVNKVKSKKKTNRKKVNTLTVRHKKLRVKSPRIVLREEDFKRRKENNRLFADTTDHQPTPPLRNEGGSHLVDLDGSDNGSRDERIFIGGGLTFSSPTRHHLTQQQQPASKRKVQKSKAKKTVKGSKIKQKSSKSTKNLLKGKRVKTEDDDFKTKQLIQENNDRIAELTFFESVAEVEKNSKTIEEELKEISLLQAAVTEDRERQDATIAEPRYLPPRSFPQNMACGYPAQPGDNGDVEEPLLYTEESKETSQESKQLSSSTDQQLIQLINAEIEKQENQLGDAQFEHHLGDVQQAPKISCGFTTKPNSNQLPYEASTKKFNHQSNIYFPEETTTPSSSINTKSESFDGVFGVPNLTRYEKITKKELKERMKQNLVTATPIIRKEKDLSHLQSKFDTTTLTSYKSNTPAPLQGRALAYGRSKDDSYDSFEHHEKYFGIVNDQGEAQSNKQLLDTSYINKQQQQRMRKKQRNNERLEKDLEEARHQRRSSCPPTLGAREGYLSFSDDAYNSDANTLDSIDETKEQKKLEILQTRKNLPSSTITTEKDATSTTHTTQSTLTTKNVNVGGFGYEEEIIETYQYTEDRPLNKKNSEENGEDNRLIHFDDIPVVTSETQQQQKSDVDTDFNSDDNNEIRSRSNTADTETGSNSSDREYMTTTASRIYTSSSLRSLSDERHTLTYSSLYNRQSPHNSSSYSTTFSPRRSAIPRYSRNNHYY